MRLERFITLKLVQPLRRFSSGKEIQSESCSAFPIPILMYHNISDDPEDGTRPYYRTNTSPGVFREHMRFLAEQGYQTLSFDQLVRHLQGDVAPFCVSTEMARSDVPPAVVSEQHGPTSALNGPQPANAKPVVITFDDGFRSFYTEAFPVLKQRGFTATVFLPTALIGPRSASTRLLFKGQECLTWAEVTQMHREGIHFGSHTVSHPRLVELNWPQIHSELSDSKTEIEQQLGSGIDSFCYPFAFPQAKRAFAARFRDLLVQTGYRACATTELGRIQANTDPFRLKRLPANSLDDPTLFQAKLEGAYDWLARPQSLLKGFKGLWRSGQPQVSISNLRLAPGRD